MVILFLVLSLLYYHDVGECIDIQEDVCGFCNKTNCDRIEYLDTLSSVPLNETNQNFRQLG